MITLAAYLRSQRLNQEAFAARFAKRISRVTVCRWLIWLEWRDADVRTRTRNPPKHALRITERRALDIEAVTNHQVSRHYLRPDAFGVQSASMVAA